MKNCVKLVGVVLATMLVSCGPRVSIPPNAVGKLMTSGGLDSGLVPPSTFRLNWAGFGGIPDRLILLDCSDVSGKENMEVFMPKDKMNLTADVRYRASINTAPENANILFSKMQAKNLQGDSEGRVSVIRSSDVYDIYGVNVLRTISRNVLTRYSIAELMENRDRANAEIRTEISAQLKQLKSPIIFAELELSDLQPPEVIKTAQLAAKEKEVAILKAEAETAIKLQQANSELQVAVKRQEVELKEAETQALVDKALTQGISETWMTMRMLRVWEAMSTNDTKVIFMPMEAMRNPSYLLGGQLSTIGNKNPITAAPTAPPPAPLNVEKQ